MKLGSFGAYGRAYDKSHLVNGYIYGAFLFGMVQFASDNAEARVVIENAYDAAEDLSAMAGHPLFLFEKLQMIHMDSKYEKQATVMHPKQVCVVSWSLTNIENLDR